MALTTTNTYIPGRKPQRTSLQPLVWDKKAEAHTIHPKREHPPQKIKETPKLNPEKMGKGQYKPRMSANERHTLRSVNYSKGTLKWQTAKGPKKPPSKGARAFKKAEKQGLRDKLDKESKHPFLTKGRHSSKLHGPGRMKSAKSEDNSGKKKSN